LIAVSSDTGEPRVKLYTGEDGNFKGDALVVYYRPESVQLAIQQYDDSDFRYGEPGPAGPMRVKLADMSYKKQKDATTKTGKEKKKIVKNLQKLDRSVPV
jgi:HIV Tat-specific factor 1